MKSEDPIAATIVRFALLVLEWALIIFGLITVLRWLSKYL